MAVAVATLASAPALAQSSTESVDAPRAKEDTVRIGTITITGSGNKLGAGQMVNEDAAKSRSTVTRAAVEKDRATGNPFQALALLPSINSFNHDATGLFGGGLTVRGFNSDQLGFTVNGVPVNDSGNFAVYPQEYVDQENVCTQSVTQGSPDSDSPHAGATGGNVSINTCDPEDKRRVRFSQSLGQLNLTRTFVRFDTGRFADNKVKMFVSYSHTQADKWKGEGEARKDHVDFAFRYDINEDNVILGSVLYNRAVNNNINSLSLAQLNANGYYFDYPTTFTPRLTPGAGAQTETAQSPVNYRLALNPFENVVASVSGSFKLATDTYLKVQPYLWHGFGNGGWSEQQLTEATSLIGGAVDLNGDGDTADRIRIGRASVTKTSRPGVTTELNTTFGSHFLKFGLWYERASHRQTQPGTRLSADGAPADKWLEDNCVKRADGTCYQGRDVDTTSTAYQAYVSDNISFMGDRGLVTLGLRAPHVTRDVQNSRNEGSTAIQSYRLKKSYDDVLPQVGMRFNIDRANQVFFNVAKNFKAPPNFAFFPAEGSMVNSVFTLRGEPQAETSVMTDVGYRLQSSLGSLSATFFNADFKDRQATAVNPNTLVSTYQNIGRTNNRGLELEAGSASFWGGFTAYASLTVQKSKVKDNFQSSGVLTGTTTAAAISLPTIGKEMTLTPKQMIGASLQYATGSYYVRLKGKYTGKQYATLMNDEEVPDYTTFDLDAGYTFGKIGFLSNTQVRANLSNLTNEKYRNPSSGTVSNGTAYSANGVTRNAQTAFYYLGAPRFFTVSLSADFE